MTVRIREATKADFDQIWAIFHDIIAAGETYAFKQDMTKQQAEALWLDTPPKTFVIENGEQILGTYFVKANQAGPGSHVCNCGYMVAASARGLGLATKMCEHSQHIAKDLGFKAMQFNCVVSSNEVAVKLWNKLGFATVGRIPKAFNHPIKGYVDTLVMYKWLEP